eukprot:m51a1_g3005 hypothetical protein (291) ;mRNA; f:802259-803247
MSRVFNGAGVEVHTGSGSGRGIVYCGRRFCPERSCPCGSCDGVCGPNNGCPCPSCRSLLTSLLRTHARRSCPAGHPLVIATNEEIAVHEPAYAGGYICNNCGQAGPKPSTRPHCSLCQYDLCPACALQGVAGFGSRAENEPGAASLCPAGHRLDRATCTRLGGVYAANGFRCDRCGAAGDATALLMHCAPCSYDLCASCAGFASPQPGDGSSGNEAAATEGPEAAEETAGGDAEHARADAGAGCLVCAQRARAVMFGPCRHFVCCAECSTQAAECPWCGDAIRTRTYVRI